MTTKTIIKNNKEDNDIITIINTTTTKHQQLKRAQAEMLFHTVEYLYTILGGSFTVFGPLLTFKQNQFGNFLYGFVYVSGFVTTLIACERWLCVSHPFTAKKLLKTKAAAIIVITSATVIVGLYYVIADKYR